MNKYLIVIVIAFVIFSPLSVYYLRGKNFQDAGWEYSYGMVHPGSSKADVRKLCQFIVNNSTKIGSNGEFEAEAIIDGVKYELSYKATYLRLDLTVTDGGEMIAFRDASADGTVDSVSRSEYSYLHFAYIPQVQPTNSSLITMWLDRGNRDYEKYLIKLMHHFNLSVEGEVGV